MASPVNLLLLDEPTNHLDLASRDVLEDALVAYPGTAVLVTHDRHVIRGVADAIVEVGHGHARWFDGTYEELRWRQEGSAADAVSTPAPAPSPPADGGAPRGRARDKRREAELRNARHRATKELRAIVERVETELTKVEERVAALTRELADPSVYEDGARVRTLVAEHGQAKDRAASLLHAWERAQLALEQAEAEVDATFDA
jgi:ATP-binding cassette subfamily F protein 3